MLPQIDRRTIFGLALALLLVGAGPYLGNAGDKFIIVQSTTSTQNSGLFEHILPEFTKKTGIDVRVVAVGTGQALKNAENGDGDVVFVHSKPDEEKFVAEGWGVNRHDVMYNDFVIVGPAADPAKIAGLEAAPEAFKKIQAVAGCGHRRQVRERQMVPRDWLRHGRDSQHGGRQTRLRVDRSRHVAQFCQQG
jgi:tungstate transport system substrate-binding protein